MRTLPEVAGCLDEAAAWVGTSMRDATSARLQLNEEPVTEFLLLRLKQALGDQVQITAYTKRQEALNGADWAFFFELPGQPTWPFRIQAKRARRGSFDLAYGRRRPWRDRQICRLIGQAARDGEIPLYALYSDQTGQSWRMCGICGPREWHDWYDTFGWRRPQSPTPGMLPGAGFSVSLLPAGVALGLALRGRSDASSVLARSSPLACLVRCADPDAVRSAWLPEDDDGPPWQYRPGRPARWYPPALAMLNASIRALRDLGQRATASAAEASRVLPPGLRDSVPAWDNQFSLVRDILSGNAQDVNTDDRNLSQQGRRQLFLQQLAAANTDDGIDRLLRTRNLDGLAVVRVEGG